MQLRLYKCHQPSNKQPSKHYKHLRLSVQCISCKNWVDKADQIDHGDKPPSEICNFHLIRMWE